MSSSLTVLFSCSHECGRTNKSIFTKFCTRLSFVNVMKPIKMQRYRTKTKGCTVEFRIYERNERSS